MTQDGRVERIRDSDSKKSAGRRSGYRIVEIKRSRNNDLIDADDEHMRNVAGHVKRHPAPRPHGGVEETTWRFSLMNGGTIR